MTRRDMERVGQCLRDMLGAPGLYLDAPRHPGATTHACIGSKIIGTVDEVTDEDGPSWVLTIAVMPEDLAS